MGWIRGNVSGAWEVGPKKQMGMYMPSQLRWNKGYQNATGHLQYEKTLFPTSMVIQGVSRGPQRLHSLVLGKVATRP